MNGPDDMSRFDSGARFRLYELLWAKLNQEGDGIWSRLNVLVGLNLALFGGFAYFFAHEPRHTLWREFSVGIALLGIGASIWSILVLKGLWAWHRHWKGQLVAIEEHFPEAEGWVTPHTDLPKDLPFWRGAPGSTQPVFWVLLVVWGVLLGLAIAYGR